MRAPAEVPEVTNDSFRRAIPHGNREQERVAARRNERLGRLHYGGEPEPLEPKTLPVFLSFRQVIGWIAFGRITALDSDPPEVARFFANWKYKTVWGTPELARKHSLAVAMRHVIARVRWWQRDKKRTRKLGQLAPIHVHDRAHVRWAIRHHGGRARSALASLLEDVKAMRAEETSREAVIYEARLKLITAIASANIEALGLPGIWRTKTHKSGQHIPIPPTFFANPNNTIRLDGWATFSDDAPVNVWATWSGPDYGDVRFKSADIVRLWPKDSLPAWLNAMQCIAWMVTRDPGVVRLAADPTPNMTAEAAEIWDLPRDGVSLHWLNLYVGRDCAESEVAALVQAARDSQIATTGLRAGDNTRQPLSADWWQDHVLAECRSEGTHEALSPCFLRPVRPKLDTEWSRILFSCSELLILWTAHRAISVAPTNRISLVLQGALAMGPPTNPGANQLELPKRPASIPSPSVAARKRVHNGLDYRKADAPLVTEMRKMIEAGRARSPEDAARGVVDRAVGGGQATSKLKRLALNYRRIYGKVQ